MSDRELTYVHSEDYSMFLKYQEENPDRECHHIVDEYFLRGRWPAKIVVTEDAHNNRMHQPIMESIEIHKELWKKDLEKIEERKELGSDQEKEDDFYGM